MTREPTEPVVVGVDGSPASMAALELAAEEALIRVAPLLVIAAGEPATYPPPDLKQMVAAAVEGVRAAHPGLVSVTGEVVVGDPAEVLLNRSRQAGLLVLGRGDLRGHAATARRSLTARVLAVARVPVEVHCGPRPSGSAGPVMVGVAGMDAGRPALEFAFAEAALRAAPLLAVHVWAAPADRGSAGYAYDLGQARDEADAMLAATLAVLSEKYPDVVVHRCIRHSLDVAVALTAASRPAQLAVVGLPGRPLTAPAVAGSIAQVLLQRARCPLAVVPVPGAVGPTPGITKAGRR